ncbi:MAG TPA: hypothetical protein VEB64_07670 [Azospirillaceae bacterium]|nr:hypothetical protein [Azospirillaceae bacterium]
MSDFAHQAAKVGGIQVFEAIEVMLTNNETSANEMLWHGIVSVGGVRLCEVFVCLSNEYYRLQCE